MANSYFQFKQFRVDQEGCGMKVSTDACILGAYTYSPTAKTILDIGTGTGLLSLMLAQSHPLAWLIDSVEIEPEAFAQASLNIEQSPWADKIHLHLSPVQQHEPPYRYDLIICNPPFYPTNKHLQSKHPQRRLAFHQDSLSFAELALSIRRLLSEKGEASLILPLQQAEEFSVEARKAGLFYRQELLIAEKPTFNPHRCIRTFSLQESKEIQQETLYIRSLEGAYSPAFRQLLRDYYLIF